MAKVGMETKRNVLKFPCGIKLKGISVWRYKVRTFVYNGFTFLLLLSDTLLLNLTWRS